MRQMSCFVQTRVKTFYFVQVTDLIIKPNFVQSSSMSLKIILCTRLSLDIVHIKVKSTQWLGKLLYMLSVDLT